MLHLKASMDVQNGCLLHVTDPTKARPSLKDHLQSCTVRRMVLIMPVSEWVNEWLSQFNAQALVITLSVAFE